MNNTTGCLSGKSRQTSILLGIFTGFVGGSELYLGYFVEGTFKLIFFFGAIASVILVHRNFGSKKGLSVGLTLGAMILLWWGISIILSARVRNTDANGCKLRS